MDRPITYYGALARAADLLQLGQNSMVGVGKLAEALLGTGTWASGFACTPTAPASMSVNIGPGQIYGQANLEASAISLLPQDTRTIIKQGLLLSTTTVTLTAPVTVGYSVNILIEAQYADADAGSTLLKYYNAANPTSPFNGPGNNGQQQPTVRQGIVSLQAKYGTPATSGTQVTPAADAGWVGLFVVTISYGQTSITVGNIALAPGAPFIATKLTDLQASLTISIPITKTIGSGGDFATIDAAWSWVGQYKITASGSVTFQCLTNGGVALIASTTTNFYHSDAARITIVGAPKSSDIALSNFTVTGYSSSARANDTTANLAMVRAKYGTEIKLTGAATQLLFIGCLGLTFRDILFTSDSGASLPMLQGVAARVLLINCVIALGGQFGIQALSACTFIMRNSYVFGCANDNINCAAGGVVSFEIAFGSFSSGGNGASTFQRGYVETFSPSPTYTIGKIAGNAGNGFFSSAGGGKIFASAFDLNAFSGAVSDGNADVVLGPGTSPGACSASNNGLDGFTIQSDAFGRAAYLAGSGNGRYGVNAVNFSNGERFNATCTGASGTVSPALNTVGNSNSLLI